MHFPPQPFGIILSWHHLFCTEYDDFKTGFKNQVPFKAVLEFPLGQMWDVKENKNKSGSSQIRQVVCKGSFHAFSHLIFMGDLQGQNSHGLHFTGEPLRTREARDPASTPGGAKWQGQSNARLILALCTLLWLALPPHL